MAQEQAKSPAEKVTPAVEDESKSPLGTIARGSERRSGDTSPLERDSELKRSTLAERLRAEQRKREEPRREEPRREEPRREEPRHPDIRAEEARREEPKREEPRQSEARAPEFTETQAPRQFVRTKRPAGPPPQRRLAPPANDDVPSIGALIYALQQRPSRTPFLMALVATGVWLLIGSFFASGLTGQGGLAAMLSTTEGLTAAIAIILPIVLFWFLALLVWRAQELRLMASAMTEVAVRLAEPDRLAEQSVASVGQTIRRQVAAMNDAISRAIGRASELEAMVHSEVAALERSYGENELRVRNLISELATEREALANNSQRVSEALKGVGAQIARDISIASTSIDKRLAERGTQLTELLVARSSEAADQVHKAQTKVAEVVPGLFERLSKEQTRLTQVIEGATQNLATLETVVAQRTTSLDKTMKERTEALQGSLAERIKGLETSVAQGAIVLDKTLKDRTDNFVNLVAQGAVTLDKTLAERTGEFATRMAEKAETLDKTMKERTEAFTHLVSQGVVTLDNTLQERADALNQTIRDRTDNFVASVGQGAEAMDQALKGRTEALTGLISQGVVVLEKTLQERTSALATSIGESAAALDNTLTERTNALAETADQRAAAIDKLLNERLSQFLSSVNQGAIALDKTLAERADSFTTSLLQRVQTLETAITQRTAALDQTMSERAQAVIAALADRLQAIDSTFHQRASETDRLLGDHARATEAAFSQQMSALNQVLANNSAMMHQTADQVGAQSKEAVTVLTSQTQNLREVSRALLDQIHGLTQRFESQGQAILTAAKALDSSNAKIDSILENRHQSIVSLLHTVNNKAEELDSTMRNYAGMVENALNQAEGRAKQVATSLARDTAGGAQQALAQIERLREEAQAHTARAVGDLKGSFEQVISQIGRQLEQMRGQFDSASRGMREAAQRTASDLDSLRQEMQKRLESLPEHTAQATAAIRKALSEQLKEIEAISPALTQAPHGNGAYRQQQPPPASPPAEFSSPAMPRFDPSGRQIPGQAPGGDIGHITGNLAQQLAGATQRAPAPGFGGPTFVPAAPPPASGAPLRLEELARAIDYRTAADVWQRLRAGERGVLGRHIYGLDGQLLFDEVSLRYGRDGEFRVTADRYIADFERMVGEAEQSDPEGRRLNDYLASDSGRVYLLLAHASGRLR